MELHEVKDELLRDFKKELDKIDFCNYNPASREFMSPLSIGLLWKVLCDIDNHDDIDEEIDGARKYVKLHKETGNPSYGVMANDELKHANMLIAIHKQEHPEKDYDYYSEEISEISRNM
jgi:hypothetical protein